MNVFNVYSKKSMNIINIFKKFCQDKTCSNDMCQNCCSRQKYRSMQCGCSITLTESLKFEKQDIIESNRNISADIFCDICSRKKDKLCKNNMCTICCSIQAMKNDCPYHEESANCKKLKEL